jgi:hypothetical protein
MTDAQLEDLARGFTELTLPKPEWTHAAHLSVGLWHVCRYGRDDALVRLRAGITRLNESHGTVNSATGGYHETITRAYAHLLSDFAARHPDKTPAERVTTLLTDPLADRKALLRFYSRPRLESSAARLDWVEPDLAPLP